MRNLNWQAIGYRISVAGLILALLWIGIFKFTFTEAVGIEPLVSNSFLMSWLYGILSTQGVSNLIGSIEIITAILLGLHYIWRKAGIIGGILSAGTFLVTLSFMFTTPDGFSMVEGVPTTDFFILKDVMALGISFMVIGKCVEPKGRARDARR